MKLTVVDEVWESEGIVKGGGDRKSMLMELAAARSDSRGCGVSMSMGESCTMLYFRISAIFTKIK